MSFIHFNIPQFNFMGSGAKTFDRDIEPILFISFFILFITILTHLVLTY